MKQKTFLLSLALSLSGIGLAGTANAFELSFQWGNIPLCTSGNPNTVPNPVFRISSPPAGVTQIQFKLVDKNVPSYNHGGARFNYAGQAEIPSGVFNYKSPCPPNGRHVYEWQATAFDAQGQAIGRATAQRNYPE